MPPISWLCVDDNACEPSGAPHTPSGADRRAPTVATSAPGRIAPNPAECLATRRPPGRPRPVLACGLSPERRDVQATARDSLKLPGPLRLLVTGLPLAAPPPAL